MAQSPPKRRCAGRYGRAFFAATALAKDLTLVTRNVKDFASFGAPLFNPWDE